MIPTRRELIEQQMRVDADGDRAGTDRNSAVKSSTIADGVERAPKVAVRHHQNTADHGLLSGRRMLNRLTSTCGRSESTTTARTSPIGLIVAPCRKRDRPLGLAFLPDALK